MLIAQTKNATWAVESWQTDKMLQRMGYTSCFLWFYNIIFHPWRDVAIASIFTSLTNYLKRGSLVGYPCFNRPPLNPSVSVG